MSLSAPIMAGLIMVAGHVRESLHCLPIGLFLESESFCLRLCRSAWICLGLLGTPVGPLPRVSAYIPEGFKEVWMGPYTLQAAGPRIIENFLDVSHLMFVHEGLLGDSDFAEIGDYQVHEEDGVLTSEEIVVYQPDPDGTGRGVHSRYVYEVFGPLSVAFTKRDRDTDHIFRLFLMVLPESEQRSQAFMLKQRNYAYEEPDDMFIQFQNVLIEQDREMVENQKRSCCLLISRRSCI